MTVYVTNPFANGAHHGHGLLSPWMLFSKLGFAGGFWNNDRHYLAKQNIYIAIVIKIWMFMAKYSQPSSSLP